MKKISTVDRALYIIIGAVLLLAGFAICVGLGYIAIGQKGIQFLF